MSLVVPRGRPTAWRARPSWSPQRGGRFGEGLVRRYGPSGLRRAHHQRAASPPSRWQPCKSRANTARGAAAGPHCSLVARAMSAWRRRADQTPSVPPSNLATTSKPNTLTAGRRRSSPGTETNESSRSTSRLGVHLDDGLRKSGITARPSHRLRDAGRRCHAAVIVLRAIGRDT